VTQPKALTKTKLAIGAGSVALAAAFVQFVPKQFWFKCPIHAVTGLYCPGGGGQRWFASLLHGDFNAAWHYNQLLSLSPILFGAYLLITKLKPGPKVELVTLSIFLAFTAAFMIWRNLPPQVTYLAQ
jgi:hypothetical protein